MGKKGQDSLDDIGETDSVQPLNGLPHPWDYWNKCDETAPKIGRAGAQLLAAWRTVELEAGRIAESRNSLDRWCDCYLFSVALHKLRRLASRAGLEFGSRRIEVAVLRFNESTVASEKVRHVLEHEEDYLFGTGRMQKGGEPGFSWTLGAKRENLSAPAEHTISVLEDRYFLPVEATTAVARTLVEEVMGALEELRAASPR